jgi:ribosomal protein S18 acetylase RimI-like enzyme
MIYRAAQPSDTEQLALLHADSWRRTYRGLFSDEFLDNEADSNRRDVWRLRLTSNRADQFVCVADDGGEISGFVCAYGHEDDSWGSLIDNLHVALECQRDGVGTQLMEQTFAWLHAHFPMDAVYLWVMERNSQAREFYEKLGASNSGVVYKPNPVGGGSALNCRYVWPEAVSLAKAR